MFIFLRSMKKCEPDQHIQQTVNDQEEDSSEKEKIDLERVENEGKYAS